MAEAVTQETRVDSYDAMMDVNAQLMTEVANDAQLTAAEKLKNFSIGVRNQVMLSRDLQARRKELFSYGMKANGATKSLGFSPVDPEPQPAAQAA